MSLLRPDFTNSKDLSIARDVLDAAGINSRGESLDETNDIRKVFSKNNASIDDAARTIGSLMSSAEKEETRLRASELALKAQGIFEEIGDKPLPKIQINIIGNGNQTLIDLVLPRVLVNV